MRRSYSDTQARAALGGGLRIDPAAIGGSSYDATHNYAYLSFLAAETLIYTIGTRRSETTLTFVFDNYSGAESGSAHICIADETTMSFLDEADVSFTAGQTGVEQTFDISGANVGDEITINRQHDHANDDLSAEVRGRIGTWY